MNFLQLLTDTELKTPSKPIQPKTVITVSGIRPDFIRMCNIFKTLDAHPHINHILVHTGQHYDALLSEVFFKDLDIRSPDYILETGKQSSNHYEQLSYLSTSIIELIKTNELNPDIILFLGDSNTVCASLPLYKEGYKIGHIEAGMRSFDKRMFEEINRTVCDHCSNILFVYHDEYKQFLKNENITENVHVVGNTILEICKPLVPEIESRRNCILVDVHRPENFKYPNRLQNIITYANKCSRKYGVPVKMLKFHGTCKTIEEHKLVLNAVELVDLMSYNTYLDTVYHSKFIISDSGTGQEEPAILGTPVIVPRDFTERPKSVRYNCSHMLAVDTYDIDSLIVKESFQYIDNIYSGLRKMSIEWLGDGQTSQNVVKILYSYLKSIE